MATLPISKIDDDCLLSIIDAVTWKMPVPNSNMFTGVILNLDRRPLDIVRAASQVSRRWRELLIGSPWIWGRLIDMDVRGVRGMKRSEWMEEVIRRAGSSALWISGTICDPLVYSETFNSQALFIQLMASWERIEKLSVVMCVWKTFDEFPSRFLSPAPILKVFNVKIHPRYNGVNLSYNILHQTSERPLFADFAPCLQEMKANTMIFKLNSPWLSGIREIELYFVGLHQIYTLLQRTPMLENLVLKPTFEFGTDDNVALHIYPKPNLPKLSSIGLNTGLAVTANVLGYLWPCKPSVVCLHISDNAHESVTGSILSSFQQNLSFYISNYFASYAPPNVHLMVREKYFRFVDLADASHDNLQIPHFRISLRLSTVTSDEQDIIMVNCLLNTFVRACSVGGNTSPPPFQSIKQITLTFEDPHPQIFSNLYSMLATYDNVRILRTDKNSGDILWEICRQYDDAGRRIRGRILFPSLQELYLINTPVCFNKDTTNTSLIEFLKNRKKIGLPIARFDLSNYRDSYCDQDFSDLEEVEGLEVVWQRQGHISESEGDNDIRRYICGSGDSQQLKSLSKI